MCIRDRSGAFLFAWTDEWFKFTWNTMEHQAPRDRRQLWHDVMTNEQYFGLVATDPQRLPGAHVEQIPDGGKIAKVTLDADASFVYVDVAYASAAREPLIVSADVVPGNTGRTSDGESDYRVEIDPRAGNGRALVRAALDPPSPPLRSARPDRGRGFRCAPTRGTTARPVR